MALQWNWATAAARHCLALGYNREHVIAAMDPIDSSRARRLFWHVYHSDRSLVLCLGRASIIQDFDVSVEPYAKSPDPGRRAWDSALFMFIDFARIQSQIYRDLYSPAAIRSDSSPRHSLVDILAQKLTEWRRSWCELDRAEIDRRDLFDLTFGLVDVSYYSTLTLLYRAVDLTKSAAAIVEPCFENARKSLEAHVAMHERYRQMDSQALAYFSVWYATPARFCFWCWLDAPIY